MKLWLFSKRKGNKNIFSAQKPEASLLENWKFDQRFYQRSNLNQWIQVHKHKFVKNRHHSRFHYFDKVWLGSCWHLFIILLFCFCFCFLFVCDATSIENEETKEGKKGRKKQTVIARARLIIVECGQWNISQIHLQRNGWPSKHCFVFVFVFVFVFDLI